MIDRKTPLKIADVGRGTGAFTRLLARLLNARITRALFKGFRIAQGSPVRDCPGGYHAG